MMLKETGTLLDISECEKYINPVVEAKRGNNKRWVRLGFRMIAMKGVLVESGIKEWSAWAGRTHHDFWFDIGFIDPTQ